MGKAFLSLLLVFTFCFSFGQTIAVSADKNNIVYIGMENPITIAAENNSSQSLIVTTDNGTISGQNGRYIYLPKSIGKANIYVQLKKGNQPARKLTQFNFRVKYNFDEGQIQFAIGASLFANGIMSKEQLLSQEYVRAVVLNTDANIQCEVEKFSVHLYSKDSVRVKYNSGNKISDEIKNELQQLKTGDILLFRDIVVNTPDARRLNIYPLMITIKE